MSQQQQPQQQQQQPGASSPADMFNNLATMYGLPSAQPNAAPAVDLSNPAEGIAMVTSGESLELSRHVQEIGYHVWAALCPTQCCNSCGD